MTKEMKNLITKIINTCTMMHDYIHECAKLTSFKTHRDVPEQATSQIMNLGTLFVHMHAFNFHSVSAEVNKFF